MGRIEKDSVPIFTEAIIVKIYRHYFHLLLYQFYIKIHASLKVHVCMDGVVHIIYNYIYIQNVRIPIFNLWASIINYIIEEQPQNMGYN